MQTERRLVVQDFARRQRHAANVDAAEGGVESDVSGGARGASALPGNWYGWRETPYRGRFGRDGAPRRPLGARGASALPGNWYGWRETPYRGIGRDGAARRQKQEGRGFDRALPQLYTFTVSCYLTYDDGG
jgi:hypothetical protein